MYIYMIKTTKIEKRNCCTKKKLTYKILQLNHSKTEKKISLQTDTNMKVHQTTKVFSDNIMVFIFNGSIIPKTLSHQNISTDFILHLKFHLITEHLQTF